MGCPGFVVGSYVEVLGVNVTVLGKVEVLLSNEDTLAEEVLVDELAVGLGNKPGGNGSSALQIFNL
jgi:pyruvate/2-oxoglutarate dehydrogenase complex dihydrolipoamide dehydrogenase (E3) component